METVQEKKECMEEIEESQVNEKELYWEIYRNNIKEEEEWRLKSRAIWLKSGDENTSFFHNYAKGRKSANTIWSLKDEEGRAVKSFSDLSGLG